MPQFPHAPSRGDGERAPLYRAPLPSRGSVWLTEEPVSLEEGGPVLLLLLLRDVTQACQGERVQAPRWGARLAAVAQGAGSCWITPGERSGVCSVGGQAVTPPSGTEIGMW